MSRSGKTIGHSGREQGELTDEQGVILLKLARSAIKSYLQNEDPKPFLYEDPAFKGSAAVFVTLWKQSQSKEKSESLNRTAALRGCIGHLRSGLPLYQTVEDAAISAATKDPRFPPVRLAELEEIIIEISVLSPFTMVTDLQDIEVGLHGLMIESYGRRGLLLPKVATRFNWTAREFLHGVCKKASLPYNAWPREANLYCFSTTTFHE